MTFYNDNEPFVAEWLKNLIAAGQISNGVVDGRPIQQLRMDELVHYGRMHFFAGIGGWDLALRWAGWPTDRPVWTGSCPCQPFSVAGKRQGTADKRHLWPEWLRLIQERRPPTIFGEQVASADGRKWLAGVFADLEELGYAVAGADLCAAGVGAPHIRQRLFWVGYANWDRAQWARTGERLVDATGAVGGGVAHPQRHPRDERRSPDQPRESDGAPSTRPCPESGRRSNAGGLDNSTDTRCTGLAKPGEIDTSRNEAWMSEPERRSRAGRLGHSIEPGLEGHARNGDNWHEPGRQPANTDGPITPAGGIGGFWDNSAFIGCADGKARRTQPGLQPLAHGIPARVGKLRAYGNAIVPQVAAAFIRAFLETEHD